MNQNYLSFVLEFVFPKICFGCGKVGEYICSDCYKRARPALLKCYHCDKGNPFGKYCNKCFSSLEPNFMLSVFAFEGFIKEAVHSFKYEDSFDLAYCLAGAMTGNIKKIDKWKTYTISFIPLSEKRETERGYNQARLLAEEIAKTLGLEVVDLLNRREGAESQVVSKSKQLRRQNIKGLFCIKNKIIPPKVILIDDVITTGATMEEASKVLKKAGGKEVVALSFAGDSRIT